MPSDINEYIACNGCEQWRDVSDNHCPECNACWSVRDDPEQNLELPIGICNDCRENEPSKGQKK